MRNSNSSSHALEAGIDCGLEGMGRLHDSRISRTRTDPDERVMNALHKMQDYLQQTKVISQMRSQKTYTEQATSRTNGNAACEAMEATTQARERQEEARLFYEQQSVKRPQKPRRSSTAPSKTLLQKAKPEKHVKKVTIRAESLATTEADFFKRLLDPQEEEKHLNELSAKLSRQNTATRATQ